MPKKTFFCKNIANFIMFLDLAKKTARARNSQRKFDIKTESKRGLNALNKQ